MQQTNTGKGKIMHLFGIKPKQNGAKKEFVHGELFARQK
jgi:hypothetical protein